MAVQHQDSYMTTTTALSQTRAELTSESQDFLQTVLDFEGDYAFREPKQELRDAIAREQAKAEAKYKEQLKKQEELAEMKKKAREEQKKIAELHHQLHIVKEQAKIEECQKCKAETMKESYERVKAVEEEKQRQYDEYTKNVQEQIKQAIGGDTAIDLSSLGLG